MSDQPISQSVAIRDANKSANAVQINDDRSMSVKVVGSSVTSDVNLVKVGGTAIALGQTTMAASVPVVLASNQSNVPVTGAVTPADNYSNPTTAVAAWALNGVWDGSNWDRLPGTSADGALVNLGTNNDVSLNAGQNNVGNVGGKTVSVTVTPTVTASNSYGTNYVVGGKLTFANMFTSTGTGIIQSVDVNIKKNETGGFTLFLFSADPSATTWTDAAVAAINATDIPRVRAPIPLTANSQLAATGFTNLSATGLGIAMAPGATSLYAVLIANAALSTQFGSTSDVSITIRALQDV